jgi:vacuolar-type H+-ATPase subunit E/Vma4
MGSAAELLVTMTKEEFESSLLEAMKNIAKQASEPEVMNVKQAAAMFDVHPITLMKKIVRERGCPVHYIGPQDPRFRRSEVLEWLSNQPKELTNGGR